MPSFSLFRADYDIKLATIAELPGNDASMTGGAYDFERATTSLTQKKLSSPKKITLVRHGLSSWNEESRVQVCRLNFFNLIFLTLVAVKCANWFLLL